MHSLSTDLYVNTLFCCRKNPRVWQTSESCFSLVRVESVQWRWGVATLIFPDLYPLCISHVGFDTLLCLRSLFSCTTVTMWNMNSSSKRSFTIKCWNIWVHLKCLAQWQLGAVLREKGYLEINNVIPEGLTLFGLHDQRPCAALRTPPLSAFTIQKDISIFYVNCMTDFQPVYLMKLIYKVRFS